MECAFLGKKCIEKNCMFWTKFTKKDAKTQELDVQYTCGIAEIPGMLLEIIKRTGGTQSATEEVRNRIEHVVTSTGQQAAIMAGMAKLAIKENGKSKAELDE